MTRRLWLPVGLGAFAAAFLAFLIAPAQEIATLPPPAETMADLEALFAHEPSYGEIQNAAMRFAEVHPDKIESWRRGASWGALLPNLTFEWWDQRDRLEDTTVTHDSNIDYSYTRRFTYTYSVQDQRQTEWQDRGGDWYLQDRTDDRDKIATRDWIRERDQSLEGERYFDMIYERPRQRWGVYFEWHLGDFLYHDHQARWISREARDLARLRQTILDELNIHWFDRRRAQIELMFSPPARTRARIDLQLRIARLTANIDALTGGYLSRNIHQTVAGK